jgi:hypothetical protein
MKGESVAPEGKVYVCAMCGKTSPGLFGTNGDWGWDESCVLNAVLANKADLIFEDKRVTKINGPTERP